MALSPPLLPRPRAPRSLTAKEHQRLESLQLHLNEPEPVLICRPCGYALKPFGERVSRHLAEKHAVSKPQRRGLSAFVKSLGLVDPNDVALRPNGLPPHEALTVARGYACRHCDYHTTSGDLISRHLSRIHSVKDSRKAESWQRDHVHCNVLLQSWSQNGPRGYWTVQPRTPESPLHPEISTNTADDLLRNASAAQQALLAAAHDAERSHLASRPSATSTITSQVDLAFQTNWIRRTGWDAMFDGACRDILLKMSELPSPARDGHTSENDMLPISPPGDEARLGHILSAVDGVFDRCEDTVRHMDVTMRCWLRSSEPHRPYKAPFELVGRPSTTHGYRRSVKRLVCFCIRLWRLPLGTRLSQCQRSLTLTQSHALGALWTDEIWQTLCPDHASDASPADTQIAT